MFYFYVPAWVIITFLILIISALIIISVYFGSRYWHFKIVWYNRYSKRDKGD